MTESEPQEELAERRRVLEEHLAKRRRELEEKQSKELEQLAEERRQLEEALERELAEERKVQQLKEQLLPCPGCGGQRATFYLMTDGGAGFIGIPISGNTPVMPLYACACVQCGRTTLRIHPKDMEKLRKEAQNERGRPSGYEYF